MSAPPENNPPHSPYQRPDAPFLVRLYLRFMRLFFHLLYHQIAWTYDLVAATVSIGRWRRWIMSILPYAQGERILEIGHGPGHLQLALRQAGKHVVGLDASPQMSRQASRRLRRAGFTNPTLLRGYAQFLPFHEAAFSSVLATFPSEYIADPHTLQEIHRILQPGGSFTILPLAWITGKSIPDRLAAALFRLTGESPVQHADEMAQLILERFPASPFVLSTEIVELQGSVLLLIHGVKGGPRTADDGTRKDH